MMELILAKSPRYNNRKYEKPKHLKIPQEDRKMYKEELEAYSRWAERSFHHNKLRRYEEGGHIE